MKNSILIFLTFLSSFAFAQTPSWCGSDYMLEAYFNANPGSRQAFYEEQSQMMERSSLKGSQNSKAPLIIVPVVIHVLHNNGNGNILKAQIEDGIRVLNEDFNRLNSDTANTRTIYKPHIADAQVEFRLARIDPNGNCTDGIVRVHTPLTDVASNAVKAVSYWDATKYLNIWLVNDIAIGGSTNVLGYAQFPNNPIITTYGAVIKHDEWGANGTATSDGRTATHELGHCFNLLHTFQGACGFSCHNSGDFVCDTPPQFDDNNNACTFTLNTCTNDAQGGSTANPNPYTTNVPDQLENFMGYGLACFTLFTPGQKDRIFAAFSTYSHLNNLRSATNLVATGTNNGYVAPTCKPIALIEDKNLKLVCIGSQLTFDEQSYQGAITSYNWKFPGATPSTSTVANPTVTYTSPGYHDVTLVVSNSAGVDSIVVSDYVYVNDTAVAYNGYNYFDGFESISGFGNDWIVLSPTGNARWLPITVASFSGVGSVFLDNHGNNSTNESDFLISPSIDMTQVINPTFKFKLAYKTKTGANDVLKCAISIDCGQTWITRFFATSGSINTGTRTSAFVPTIPSDWLDITVTTTAAIRASTNAIFRFDFKAGTTLGNNIFFDDFKVDGASVVGINDIESFRKSISLYPNPVVDGVVKLDFLLDNDVQDASIFLTDILGKRIKDVYNGSLNSEAYQFNISTEKLSSGVYFLSIQAGNKNVTK
ncbi:MAG: PKD domain-containing protein, partial [Flavobacteriales bacterium]|nr:PKD domain-containing protein [Flavobacteriales bacterium]